MNFVREGAEEEVIDATLNEVPAETGNQPVQRNGESVGSVVPHLQQQAQTRPRPKLTPPPDSGGQSGAPGRTG